MGARLHPATCGEMGERLAVLLGMVRQLATKRRLDDDRRCNAQTWAWLFVRKHGLDGKDLALIARRAVSRAFAPHDGLDCQQRRHDALRHPWTRRGFVREPARRAEDGRTVVWRCAIRDWVSVASRRLSAHHCHYLSFLASGLSGKEAERLMGLWSDGGQRCKRAIRNAMRAVDE